MLFKKLLFSVILSFTLACSLIALDTISVNNEIVVFAVNQKAQDFKLVQFEQAKDLLQKLQPIAVKKYGERQTCQVKTTYGSVEAFLHFSAATNAQVLELVITDYHEQTSLDNPVVSAISHTFYQAIKEGQVLFIPAGEVTFVLYLPFQAVSA